MEIPTIVVTFDDGTSYTVECKPRDLLQAERAGHSFDGASAVETMYAVALGALRRLQATGAIPAEVDLPKSVDDFSLVADVEAAEGKDG